MTDEHIAVLHNLAGLLTEIANDATARAHRLQRAALDLYTIIGAKPVVPASTDNPVLDTLRPVKFKSPPTVPAYVDPAHDDLCHERVLPHFHTFDPNGRCACGTQKIDAPSSTAVSPPTHTCKFTPGLTGPVCIFCGVVMKS